MQISSPREAQLLRMPNPEWKSDEEDADRRLKNNNKRNTVATDTAQAKGKEHFIKRVNNGAKCLGGVEQDGLEKRETFLMKREYYSRPLKFTDSL